MEKFVPRTAKVQKPSYLAIAAHKDDTELMAMDGILKGQSGGFATAVLTDGGVCPRGKGYETLTNEQMAALRTDEQKKAAETGGYSAVYLLEKTSQNVKDVDRNIVVTLMEILEEYAPLEALYIHSPFDCHPTHVAAFKCAVEAVRLLESDKLPKHIYCCEVWRNLDWLPDGQKLIFDVSQAVAAGADGVSFADKLFACFRSQNSAKQYGKGYVARSISNATFCHSHAANNLAAINYGFELPLNRIDNVNPFVNDLIKTFVESVYANLR